MINNEKKHNPLLNEECLEHGLMFCLKYKKMGKTLDDLIEHLQTQLYIIKEKKFENLENEVYSRS